MEKPIVLLIDLSALYHAAHHVVAENESITRVQELTIGGVRKAIGMVASEFIDGSGNADIGKNLLVAVCCDSRGSWRKKLYADYKSHREAKPESFYGMFEATKRKLEDEGYLLWSADGYEADDIIATACDSAVMEGHDVVIASHDKDLCQLASDHVTILRTHDWKFAKPEDILNKFGVTPFQLTDYLALMGDTSDNVPGCKGVGAKKAAELISTYGSISRIYDAVLAKNEDGSWKKDGDKYLHNAATIFEPFWKSNKAMRANLADCFDQVMLSRKLVSLDARAPIDFKQIYQERKMKNLSEGIDLTESDESGIDDDVANLITSGKVEEIKKVFPTANQVENKVADNVTVEAKAPEQATTPAKAESPTDTGSTFASALTGLGPRDGAVSFCAVGQGTVPHVEATVEPRALTVVAEFTKQLEPRTADGALKMARVLFDSRLYGKYSSAEQIFAAMARGRAMGYCGAEALDLFWPMDLPTGRVLAPKAHLVIHLGESHPDCEYLILVESDWEKATYAIRRKSWPKGREVTMTYTVDDAVQAGLTVKELLPPPVDEKGQRVKDTRNPWQKNRRDMLRKQCGVLIVRSVLPGAGLGLATYEELGGE